MTGLRDEEVLAQGWPEGPSIFPDQPMYISGNGEMAHVRFVPNRIVRDYAEGRGPKGFHQLAVLVVEGKYTEHEQAQFQQLMGYSVSAWGSLRHHPHDVSRCDSKAAAMWDDYHRSAVDKLADLARDL